MAYIFKSVKIFYIKLIFICNIFNYFYPFLLEIKDQVKKTSILIYIFFEILGKTKKKNWF